MLSVPLIGWPDDVEGIGRRDVVGISPYRLIQIASPIVCIRFPDNVVQVSKAFANKKQLMLGLQITPIQFLVFKSRVSLRLLSKGFFLNSQA